MDFEMNTENSADRYATASIILHWLMLALLAAVYAAIELREFFPKGSGPREALKSWHFMLGLTVFVLVWVRIGARLLWRAPDQANDGRAWQHLAARAVHFALYALMIGMPMAGWVILSAEGKAVPFFGLELPPLTGRNEALGEQVEAMHKLAGTAGYWLIGIHASAVLFHNYLLRDGVLRRMLPARS
jgi:cytochrome b561